MGVSVFAVIGDTSRGKETIVTFTIGMNQFWSINNTEEEIPPFYPEYEMPRPMRLAAVDINFPIDSPFSKADTQFYAKQSIGLASVLVSLTTADKSQQINITSIVSRDKNMLITTLSTLQSITLTITTSTNSSLFPSSAGCTNRSGTSINCSLVTDDQIIGDFISRQAYYKNDTTFPVVAALLTRVFGSYELISSVSDEISQTSSHLTFNQDDSITTISYALSNLDLAGIDHNNPIPPVPVIGIDPLPAAQEYVASTLTIDQVIELSQNHSKWWQGSWTSATLVFLPDDPVIERYWYGAQYIITSAAKMGTVAPGLWGPLIQNDKMSWHGD